jgi:hypothetical protein
MISYKDALKSYIKGLVEIHFSGKSVGFEKEYYLKVHKEFLLNLCKNMKILGLKFRNYTLFPGKFINPKNISYQFDINFNVLSVEDGWMIVSKEEERMLINECIQIKEKEIKQLEKDIEMLKEHLKVFVDRDWNN